MVFVIRRLPIFIETETTGIVSVIDSEYNVAVTYIFFVDYLEEGVKGS